MAKSLSNRCTIISVLAVPNYFLTERTDTYMIYQLLLSEIHNVTSITAYEHNRDLKGEANGVGLHGSTVLLVYGHWSDPRVQ
jgi:hypothetical protein